MARAVFVKSARKDNPSAGIKKGDSYWWASFRTGRSSYKRYWKEKPKRSQLTQSAFFSQIYDLEDQTWTGENAEDLKAERDDMAQALRDLAQECRDNKDNMPDTLQESETGQLLETRADGCESTADAFEAIDLDDFDGDEDTEDEATWAENKRQELSDVSFEYE